MPLLGVRPLPPRPPSKTPADSAKVLPKDISRDDLIKIMRGFTGALGVECGYCHALGPRPSATDFASNDANPVKEKARVMIAMTDSDISKTYLTQLASRKSTDSVTCGTCHRGMAVPEAFVPKPRTPAPGRHTTSPPGF